MKQTEIIKNAYEKLAKFKENKKLLLGFDGFVDEIISVVDKRQDFDNFSPIKTIEEFGQRIIAAAGLSANIELVTEKIKLGGNGTIMANALINQGYEITYIGALGEGDIHPVFKDFTAKCKQVISLSDPGYTQALEFEDGKLLMGKLEKLKKINWDMLQDKLNIDEVEKLLNSVSLIAFTNWTMLPELNSIIIKFSEMLKRLNHKPAIFFDLADPQKRTNSDIKEILKIISNCENSGFVLLGLNKKESKIIADVLDINENSLPERAAKIKDKLKISSVIIHPREGAVAAYNNQSNWVDGPLAKNPKLSTGAGDNFNSGFCNGWLAGLSPEECVAVGVCTSGYYVRNAKSPNRKELLDFMKEWYEKNCGEI